MNGIATLPLLLLLFGVFAFFASNSSLAQPVSVYVGNTLTNSGAADGDPPLVILGEYSPQIPSSNSTVTLPAGVVEDVKFYSGTNYDFTLYDLSWSGNGLYTNEQTFQIVASESFSNNNAVAGLQTIVVTGFQVNAGDFLAFWGTGPYYVTSTNGLDATYANPGGGNAYTATNPVILGTNFTVGANGDLFATYDYIPSFGSILPSRTYAFGVDCLTTNFYTFLTIAGRPVTTGSTDGLGTNALFNDPQADATAANLDVFMADTGNSTIRKVTSVNSNWLVTTIAGRAGITGSSNGIGTNALFYSPKGIAVSSNETVFVADTLNETIRMMTLTTSNNWAVSTIAGIAGTMGTNNGTNVAGYFAKFNAPEGIAVDSKTNVFVADTTNDTIRKITLTTNGNWVVTTIAGLALTPGSANGSNSVARFKYPEGVAVDNAGNVYVADSGNNTIRKLTQIGTNWVVTTIAGSSTNSGSTDGTNNSALFYDPGGVAVDSSNNLYVADTGNDIIRKIVPSGTNWIVYTIGGLATNSGYVDATGANARFTNPRGIAVNWLGHLFVDRGDPGLSAGISVKESSNQNSSSYADVIFPSTEAVSAGATLWKVQGQGWKTQPSANATFSGSQITLVFTNIAQWTSPPTTNITGIPANTIVYVWAYYVPSAPTLAILGPNFGIYGIPNTSYNILYSTDLINWNIWMTTPKLQSGYNQISPWPPSVPSGNVHAAYYMAEWIDQ